MTENTMADILGGNPNDSIPGPDDRIPSNNPTSTRGQSEFNEIINKMKKNGGKKVAQNKQDSDVAKSVEKNSDKKVAKKVKKGDGKSELDISAKDCFNESIKNDDGSIDDYIIAINGKIRNETLQGGFSTVIQFRVAQGDWVNINRILDFYKVHGFTIENFSSGTSPYAGAAAIDYEFTISWATSNK